MKPRDAERALAGANPVAETALGALEIGAGEEELLAAIVAEPRPGPARRRVSPSRGPRLALVAAATAALAAAAVVIGFPGGEEEGPRGGLAALDRVAAAAAEQPAPAPELPYGYLKTRGTYVDVAVSGGEARSTPRSEVVETWAAPDGSGRRRTVALVAGREGNVGTESFPAGTFAGSDSLGADLAGLPTDPEDLSRWLIDRVSGPAGNGFPLSVRTLTLVAELLQNPFAPPELRASLYEAEALVPGIEDLGAARDELGREGIAVGARSANSGAPTVYSLIVDPRTSEVLATEQTQLRAPAALPELDEPLVISSTAYLQSGRTASIPRFR
ncbi:MAG TPA: CU044_5270 family protein [Solirubrobacterales bacterium]